MTTVIRQVPTLPGAYSEAEAINRILAVAASQIGYREGSNNDTAYGKWFGLNYNPWCHMFVSWCAEVADFQAIIPKDAYTPRGFNWFAAKGAVGGRKPPSRGAATGLGRPKRGDVMYVHGLVSGEWRIHHVGLVENVLPGGYIQTVEGNTSTTGSASGNGVYRLKRKITSKLFFATPNYAAVVKARPKPPAKPPVKPAPSGGKPVAPPAATQGGFPLTGGSPKVDSAKKQLLDLNVLVAASKNPHTPTYAGYAMTAAAMRSLKAMKMAPPGVQPTGPNFRAAWRKWQISLGYKGRDADGIPGAASFSRFIERTGRSRKSPGYKAR